MYLFYSTDIVENSYLSEEESGHCIKVLRKKINDIIYIVDGKGGFFTAKIIEDNQKKTKLRIIKSEKEYNKRLSTSRAVSVRKYIKRLVPLVKIDEVKGIGASNLQFDNDLPEGRFYCRTVLIEVKTPLE